MSAQTRELARSSCHGKLGDRAMVRLEPRVVTLYRVEWEYDGTQADYDEGGFAGNEPVRRLRVKAFRNKGSAYKWMALRLIFAKRNKLATTVNAKGYPDGCSLCSAEVARVGYSSDEDGPVVCRYHDHGGEHLEQLRARLARWLKWRDSRL